ncbi:SlyX family protein [Spongiibacter nanhainus]|uniref:SlyX family protein n=1 Tax=Spongiibacter nanhainus TaxID=2794344 RepID=A0A7T4QYB4_9GAMM|nr:SlyX family protein [Spongiibacter nanhainus]QQD16949.1 SlyX family protein [Spongiibacter nanhainus]
MEQQLIDLQTQLAFQEDLLTALDDRVAKQDRYIREMETTIQSLRLLVEQLQVSVESGASAGGAATPEEKPPHY